MASEMRKQLILQDQWQLGLCLATQQEKWQDLQTWQSHAVSKMLLQKGEKQPGGPVAAQLNSAKQTSKCRLQLYF